MHIDVMQDRAMQVRARFAAFEEATYGEQWSIEDLVMGLMTDVGDLAAIVQRMEGKRPANSRDPAAELSHELSDCLWVLLVLADRYDVDLENAFAETMDGIDNWLTERMSS